MGMFNKLVINDDNTAKGLFRRPRAVRVDASGPSITEQSHAKECDVNFIMKRFQKTGQLPVSKTAQPVYIDVTNLTDFQDMHNKVAAARQKFEALPAAEREKYGNKVEKWIEGKLAEAKALSDKRIADAELAKLKDELIEAKKPKEKGA